MVKVLVADDHAVVRKGLKHLLSKTHDLTGTDEAGTRRELFEKVAKSRPDMVVLDISMPGRNGINILKEIKSQKPKLPVLMLGKDSEEQYAIRALKAGASGCLTKESQPEEFIKAIRRVSQGGKYISYSLTERWALNFESNSEKPLYESLSDQEYQVICMLPSPEIQKVIYHDWCLRIETISTYRF